MSGVPATNKIIWADKVVYCCDSHLLVFIEIGNALGSAIEYSKYQGDKECKNCEKEREREDNKS